MERSKVFRKITVLLLAIVLLPVLLVATWSNTSHADGEIQAYSIDITGGNEQCYHLYDVKKVAWTLPGQDTTGWFYSELGMMDDFLQLDQVKWQCDGSANGNIFIVGTPSSLSPVTSIRENPNEIAANVAIVPSTDRAYELSLGLVGTVHNRNPSKDLFLFGGNIKLGLCTDANGTCKEQQNVLKIDETTEYNDQIYGAGYYIPRGKAVKNKHQYTRGDALKITVNSWNFYHEDTADNSQYKYHTVKNAADGKEYVYRWVGIHRCWWEGDDAYPTRTSSSCKWHITKLWGLPPNALSPDTGFDGKTTPFIDNRQVADQTVYTLPEGVSSVKVGFRDEIKRTDNGTTAVSTKYWTTGSSGTSNLYVNGAENSPKQTNPLLASNGWQPVERETTNIATITLQEGESRLVCQTMYYYKKVKDNIPSDKASVTSCVTITRDRTTTEETGDAGTNVKVVTTNGTYRNQQTVTTNVNDGYFHIYWEHWIRRSDDKGGDHVGGPQNAHVTTDSRNVKFSTTVSGTTNNSRITLSKKGTKRTNATKAHNTKNSIKNVVEFNDEHWEGYLYPGEERKFCQSVSGSISYSYQKWEWWYNSGYPYYIDYYHYVGKTGSSSMTGAQRCVTIKRAKLSCSVDTETGTQSTTYGVNSGENIASMSVRNNTNGQRKTITNSGEKTIYAKPGDYIQYVYKSCAGGQPGADYNSNSNPGKSEFKYEGTNSTATSANKKKYLFGSMFSTSPTTETFGNSASQEYKEGKSVGTNYISPSDSSYGCNWGNSQWYQVPPYSGWARHTSGCNSAVKVGRSSETPASDVGSKITQTLTYTYKKVTGLSVPSSSTKTIKGNVVIPFNYNTRLTTSNTSNTPITAGQTFEANLHVYFETRRNNDVYSGSYGTHTKSTTVKTYYWIEDPSATADSINNRVKSVSTGRYVGEANGGYITNGESSVATHTTTTTRVISSGKFYDTPSDFSVAFSQELAGNIGIGAKVCAAVAVNPADSHDDPNNTSGSGLNQNKALQSSGSYWLTSKPTCRTVGKKPTFAVTGGNTYAYNGVDATTFTRNVNGGKYLFSSIEQYTAASAKSGIVGFATGASTWGGSEKHSSNERTCTFSAMTLVNSKCKSNASEMGKISLSTSSDSSPQQTVKKLKDRYILSSSAITSKGIPDATVVATRHSGLGTLYGSCVRDATTKEFKPDKSDPDYACLDNGMKYTYASGDLTFDLGPGGGDTLWISPSNSDSKNWTNVIDIKGTFYIKDNFRYGSVSTTDKTLFQDIASIPQRIIVAKKIVIDSSVTQIDGWLIADEIVTCNTTGSSVTVNQCNKQLTINGPVITKKLTLGRTYGSGANASSITSADNNNKHIVASPAEIFNIGPETYLWIYAQYMRTGQASTTYQRELAPRY